MATIEIFCAGASRGARRCEGFPSKHATQAAIVRDRSIIKVTTIQRRGISPRSRFNSLPLLHACGGDIDMVESKSPIVSVDWLYEHLNEPHVKILDASWYMPAEQRNPFEEFKKCRLPRSLFFDIDGIVDDKVDLPHMLPLESCFAAAAAALGLENADTVVVYDGKGIFSSARVWWMFKVFGHENVYVLDGGLPKWRAKAYPVDTSVPLEILSMIEASVAAVRQPRVGSTKFRTSFQRGLVWSLEQVKQNVRDKTFQHIDARSKARFDGVASEPRKGVRSGHVPGSKCVPFTEILSEDGTLLPVNALQKVFDDSGLKLDNPVVASCGTGVTACILALALHQLGVATVPVYDGSWTEWGGLPESEAAVATISSIS